MPRFLSLFLIMVAAFAATAHAQADKPALEPSSSWNVDYADAECRLLRTFGTGENAITLRLARGGNPGLVDVILAGPGILKLPSRTEVTMTLEPEGQSQSANALSLAIPNGAGRFIRWSDASLELFDRVGDNQVIAFASGKSFAVRLNVPGAKAGLKALDACYLDLLESWGASPEDAMFLLAARSHLAEVSREVTARRADLPAPKNNPGSWVTDLDYPSDALRKEQSGDVVVMLSVDAKGVPTACRVAVSSKVESLDQATCRALQSRARYNPPRDAAGLPRSSVRFERIRWVIPQFDW